MFYCQASFASPLVRAPGANIHGHMANMLAPGGRTLMPCKVSAATGHCAPS